MAYIPVNPERRDPGYFKKKAEIGLPSVDNMSAAEFVSAVSEDLKILGNKKKLSSKITKKGEFYGGIIKTAPKNSHANFTLGLFDSSDLTKELASVHVDFVFSCTSTDEFGNVNYTIGCPDNDPYLKDLYIVFSQVQDQLYISLHSPSLPERFSQVYFNVLGVNLIDWTNGVEKLDSSKDISEIVRNSELARVRLTGPSSTFGSGEADSLAVYDLDEKKVSLDTLSSLDGLDYPSINGVPFIGKKNLIIGNKEEGRHITVPALHKDSTKEGSGVHDWEVLGDLRKINLSRSGNSVNLSDSTKVPNDPNLGYGLVRPSKYTTFESSSNSMSSSNLVSWLNSLGDDTDVITVGAFREYMYCLTNLLFNAEESFYLYLENQEDSSKYIPSGKHTFTINVSSFKKNLKNNDESIVDIEISCSSTGNWITAEKLDGDIDNSYKINFKATSNSGGVDRNATITIKQPETGREINISVVQSKFEVIYGVLLGGVPVYESSGYSLDRWENGQIAKTIKIIPIKTSPNSETGYEEINEYRNLTFTNTNSWISGELTNGSLNLLVESNYKSTIRTGTIYIGILEKSGEDIKYIPIKCSQEAVTSYLNILDSDNNDSLTQQCTVGKEESIKRFLIKSNYTWYVSEDQIPSWISLSGYTGERPPGDSYLTLVISENNTRSDREGKLYIINKKGDKGTITVKQSSRTVYIDINNQPEDQFFSFGVNSAYNISSVKFNVNSNVNWFIDQCPSWIKPNKYDGGEQGEVTSTPLTLSMPEPEYSTVGEVVSLSYYDSSSDTIIALRKITILPSVSGFSDSSNYVLPQTPLTIEVSSEGGPVTVGALANTRYKLFPIDEKGPLGVSSPYIDMLEGYGPDTVYLSESPKSDVTKQTSLTFNISRNNSYSKEKFRFALVPEYLEEEDFSESDYPIFEVIQSGNKSVTPFVYNDSETTKIKRDSLNFWVNAFSGVTTSTQAKPPIRNPRQKTDPVYKSFYAKKGQIIVISDGSSLYKTESEVTVLGDTIKRISSDLLVRGWYVVSESGYYFSTDEGNASIINPTKNKYICDYQKTEFTLTLLSVMDNCWDVYNETLPEWISLEKISGISEVDSFKVIVDENIKDEHRDCVLQFYVDSTERSIESFTIEQLGFEIIQKESELVGVMPIISSGKSTFTSSGFELGLSALAKYSSSVISNGEKNDYNYSEYIYSGVNFSVSGEGASISSDSLGKQKLMVQENTNPETRTIRITATYGGKSGSIDIIQGSPLEIKFYTYENITIEPRYTTLPIGISKFDFVIKGRTILNTLNLSTKKQTGNVISEKDEIKFPYLRDKFSVNEDSGLSLISPDTLEYSGNLQKKLVISCPTSEYSFDSTNKLVEVVGSIKTPETSFDLNQKEGVITVDNTLLSSTWSESGKNSLSTKLSFTKYPEITITKKSNSANTENYLKLENSISSDSGTKFSGSLDITAKLERKLLDYLENKIITLEVSDPESKSILKYIHFRNMRSNPTIEYKIPKDGVNHTNGSTTARIEVNSNIGYESSSWNNNPDSIFIENGEYKTSEARFEDTKIIQYSSESQPYRKWFKKYSTESLILKDSDNYGISKEIPIVLPKGFGSTFGFEILLDNEKICSFDGNNTSYDLELPHTANNERVFEIKAYDSYEVALNRSDGTVTFEDSRNSIQKKVGSLNYTELKIKQTLPNLSSSRIFRGSIILNSSSAGFIINIYQSAQVGLVNIINPETKTIVVGKHLSKNLLGTGLTESFMAGRNIEFTHTYPGWMIVSQDIVDAEHPTIPKYNRYPTFNEQNFSNSYGSGGNYGSDYSDESKKSSKVKVLCPSGIIPRINNTSLELKLIGDCTTKDILIPSRYGIKTDTALNLSTSEKTVGVTDTFEIKVKPEPMNFKVYQKPDMVNYVEASSLEVVLNSTRFSNTRKGTLEIYVSSDVFDRTKPYIGKTLMIDGKTTNITNNTNVFEKIFERISFTYHYVFEGSIGPNSTPSYYRPTGYVSDGGTVYACYEIPVEVPEEASIDGEITFSMRGFVVDSNYYTADETITLTLPVKEKIS